MDILSPGKQAELSYKLPPGTYVLLCFIADDKTGLPHVAMGMHKVAPSPPPRRAALAPSRLRLHRVPRTPAARVIVAEVGVDMTRFDVVREVRSRGPRRPRIRSASGDHNGRWALITIVSLVFLPETKDRDIDELDELAEGSSRSTIATQTS